MSKGWEFVFDERLGIALPQLERDWNLYSRADQERMIETWEKVKARIPDRVHELEAVINVNQLQVSQEDDWDTVCDLYAEIYRIASIINDLNIWKNVEQYLSHQEEQSPGIAEEHTNREK
ncbi:hypothetical protein [Tumebacillus algifaecis]|nr:hypothetical protein [Tumebacillus algifaecis]